MYTTESLDPVETARELVDLIRQRTDCRIDIAQETTLALLACLIRRGLRDCTQLREIASSCDHVGLIDPRRCVDATRLTAVVEGMNEVMLDKQQRSWQLENDEFRVIDLLREFVSIAEKADRRVTMLVVAEQDFCLLQRLVDYYKLESRDRVRQSLLATFSTLCKVDEQCRAFLLESSLAVQVALQVDLAAVVDQQCTQALALIAELFASGDSPPVTVYDVLDETFLSRLIVLAGAEHEEAMSLLLNFNQHLPPGKNLVISALLDLGTEAAGFTQRFLIELNASNSSDRSEKALKLLADLVQLDDFQPSMLFYSNDLRVLGDILNQQLRDTASQKVENPSLSRHFAETRIDRPGLGAIAIA